MYSWVFLSCENIKVTVWNRKELEESYMDPKPYIWILVFYNYPTTWNNNTKAFNTKYTLKYLC